MTQLSGAMASIVLLVMTVIFMLFEVRHLPYKLRFALNNPRLHIAGLHRALKGVTHYLALKTLISLWTGLIVWLGLLAMGVQFALMWGVLAFLLNYVPNIGSAISAIPPMLQALLFSGIYEVPVGRALFLVVHMVLGNMVEPRMMGHRLGMSTLVVFLSLLVWGWLLGPVGMLLSSAAQPASVKIWMETTVRRQQAGDPCSARAVPKPAPRLAAFHRPEDGQYAGDDDRRPATLPVERLMPAGQPDGGGPHEDIARAQ